MKITTKIRATVHSRTTTASSKAPYKLTKGNNCGCWGRFAAISSFLPPSKNKCWGNRSQGFSLLTLSKLKIKSFPGFVTKIKFIFFIFYFKLQEFNPKPFNRQF